MGVESARTTQINTRSEVSWACTLAGSWNTHVEDRRLERKHLSGNGVSASVPQICAKCWMDVAETGSDKSSGSAKQHANIYKSP